MAIWNGVDGKIEVAKERSNEENDVQINLSILHGKPTDDTKRKTFKSSASC